MITWFKISINGGTGYMKLVDGEMVGYFDEAGQPITAQEGTSVSVIENDVAGPSGAGL